MNLFQNIFHDICSRVQFLWNSLNPFFFLSLSLLKKIMRKRYFPDENLEERIHDLKEIERDEFKTKNIEWKEKSIDLDFQSKFVLLTRENQLKIQREENCFSLLPVFQSLSRYFFLLSEKVREWEEQFHCLGNIPFGFTFLWLLFPFLSSEILVFFLFQFFLLSLLSIFLFPLKVISGSFLRQCLW